MAENTNINEDYLKDNKAAITRVLSQDNEKSNESSYASVHHSETEDDLHEHTVVEDQDNVGENEILSLEAKEEELIRKALLKNNGRREKGCSRIRDFRKNFIPKNKTI